MMEHTQETYALIVTRGADGEETFRCGRGQGGEAFLKVYRSVAAAEAHLMLANLDPEVSSVEEWPAGKLSLFLDVFVFGAFGYVAVDPPLSLEDGPPQPVVVVPVEEFVRMLDHG